MQKAEKLSITLTAEMVKTIHQSVAAGEYASTSEVLRDAMRVWQREREEHSEWLASVKARIDASIDDPRPKLSLEQVKERLAKLHAATVEAEKLRRSA